MAKKKNKRIATKLTTTPNQESAASNKKAVIETIPFYSGGFWKDNWWKALIIFLLPFALYYQSTNFGFVLDDQIVFSEKQIHQKRILRNRRFIDDRKYDGVLWRTKRLSRRE